jgi:hypothetical protein
MTAALWTVGGLVIVAAGLWPLRTVLKRPPRRYRDEARSLLSQLGTALDLAAGDLPADDRAAAERYQLLAGAALAGKPDQDAYQRSIEWSRTGLKLISGS